MTMIEEGLCLQYLYGFSVFVKQKLFHIMQAGVPAVTVQQPDSAMQVLQDRARQIQVKA